MMAVSLLRAVKQKPGENIQLFAERMLSLADQLKINNFIFVFYMHFSRVNF